MRCVRFGPSELSCLGSLAGRAFCLECRVSWVGPSELSCLDSLAGRAFCLECRVSWVRIPPEAECHGFESYMRQLIFLWKSDCLG